jgi:hypothetical protein
MTEDHRQQADAADRELADMEERSERVGEHIEEARKDWDAKVADASVPGAGGNPDRAEEGGEHPETAYPAKGSAEEASEPDPAGKGGGDASTSQRDGGAEDDAPQARAEGGDGGSPGERGSGDELPPPDPHETD